MQEAGHASLVRSQKAGLDLGGAGTDVEGPDLAAPPAARASLEKRAEVTAAAGSRAPQLAAEVSLAQLQPEGALARDRATPAAASAPSESEAEAAVGAASAASLQGSGDEVMAKRHDQTVRVTSLASQLQLNLDARASGACCNAEQRHVGKDQGYPSPAECVCATCCLMLCTTHSSL